MTLFKRSDWSDIRFECSSSSSRTCHHVILTEITAASRKQSLQPVPFSLIMWWATLDYINQFVCTRKSVWVCVCVEVVSVIPEKAFTFAHLILHWICVGILQKCLVIITELQFSFLYYCLLLYCLIQLCLCLKIRLSRQLVCPSVTEQIALTAARYWTQWAEHNPRSPLMSFDHHTSLDQCPTGNVYFTPHAVMG